MCLPQPIAICRFGCAGVQSSKWLSWIKYNQVSTWLYKSKEHRLRFWNCMHRVSWIYTVFFFFASSLRSGTAGYLEEYQVAWDEFYAKRGGGVGYENEKKDEEEKRILDERWEVYMCDRDTGRTWFHLFCLCWSGWK